VGALVDLVPPSVAQPADVPAQVAARAAAAAAAAPQPPAAAGEPAPPREGVRPPGELRQKLQEGSKPKWLKL
jgi:hypothetical protein